MCLCVCVVCRLYIIVEYLGSEGILILIIGYFDFLQFFLCLNLCNVYLLSSNRNPRGRIFTDKAVLYLCNYVTVGKDLIYSNNRKEKITFIKNRLNIINLVKQKRL